MNRSGVVIAKYFGADSGTFRTMEAVEPQTLHTLSPYVMTRLMVVDDGDGDDGGNDDVYGDDASPKH